MQNAGVLPAPSSAMTTWLNVFCHTEDVLGSDSSVFNPWLKKPIQSMKMIILFIALLGAVAAQAQIEIAPREESQKAALQLNNAMGEPDDVPFKLETDLLHPFALKANEVAMLAVPVHSLNEKIRSANDGDTIPVGLARVADENRGGQFVREIDDGGIRDRA